MTMAAKKKSTSMKTTKTRASASEFLAAVPEERVRRDCKTLVTLLKRITGEPPAMWGPSLVGFGQYHYKYASGREGDWPIVSFSPRKKNITVYVMPGFAHYQKELARLGPHKLGKSCLYLDSLADIDLGALESILKDAVKRMKSMSA
jgi:hypothetical protein